MARSISTTELVTDLVARIEEHQRNVATLFEPLSEEQLLWQPDPKEWSILQCFDHLNLTHQYYMPKVTQALENAVSAAPGADRYAPSFWAGIYMHFAFNPRYSFSAPTGVVPGTALQRTVLNVYLEKQEALLRVLDRAPHIDLCRTRVPIAKGVSFNLGDCLKILVYHDGLHMRQACNVRALLPS
jgi:hypothetical protein